MLQHRDFCADTKVRQDNKVLFYERSVQMTSLTEHGWYIVGEFGGVKERDGKPYSDVFIQHMGGSDRLQVRADSDAAKRLAECERGSAVTLRVTAAKSALYKNPTTGETRAYLQGLLVLDVTASEVAAPIPR